MPPRIACVSCTLTCEVNNSYKILRLIHEQMRYLRKSRMKEPHAAREGGWPLLVYCFFTVGGVNFLQLFFAVFVGKKLTVLGLKL